METLEAKIEERRAFLARVFEEAGPEVDLAKVSSLEGDVEQKAEEIRRLNEELGELVAQAERERELRAIRAEVDELGRPVEHPGHVVPAKGQSIGELFVRSPAFRGWKRGMTSGPVATLDISGAELKALFQTSAGWPPETLRSGRLVEEALRPIRVLDILPVGETSQAAVVYMEETSVTAAAAETAEGAAYPEATLALTEQSSPVRKIAVWLPVTDEQMEDVEGVQSYVEQRLAFFLRQRLDEQVIVGNGTAPNLRGFLNVSGIQTQAKGADPTPDAIYKAMVKVMVVGRATPTAIVIHPNDWQEIKLLRSADGIYIWGSPSEAGPDRIWGMPVVQSDAITEGTALVGDFAGHSQLFFRRGVEVQVGYQGADFVQGRQAVRADLRAALAVYRPEAFCTVTGI